MLKKDAAPFPCFSHLPFPFMHLEAPNSRHSLCQDACLLCHPLAKNWGFFSDSHKKEKWLGYGSLPRQGCRDSLPALFVGMDVFCCGLFLLVQSPRDPVCTLTNRERLNPKVREGRGRGWSEAGIMGWPEHPLDTAECGTWGEESPAGSVAGAGIRETLPADGFSGGCHEFFNMGKT